MDIVLERILSLLPCNEDGRPVHGSKSKLARSIGAPSNIFAEWCAGRNKSYNNYIYQIAEKYGVSPEWLRGETDEKNAPDPKIEGVSQAKRALLDALDDLTDEQCEKLLPIVLSAKAIL